MAVFQYNGRNIAYRTQWAPFPFDLVLLQGSDFTVDYWGPIIGELEKDKPQGGRLVTCEWFDSKLPPERLAEDFVRLLQTLGLSSLHILAVDDAVDVASRAQQLQPHLIQRTLFFPDGGPKGDGLRRAVRDLCQF